MSLANRVATILGIGFLLIGVAGFLAPAMLGMHLSATHSIVHLATGAVSLWLGLKGSAGAARTFCIAFGLVYLLLGVAGFVAGTPGSPTGGHPGPEDAKLLKVLPGVFEVGTADHVVHILLGAIYLIAGFATKRGITGATARI